LRFIDSNVFVYHLVADPHYGKRATAILESVENGEDTITSTLPISQVCGYLRWRKKEKIIPVFLDLVRGLTSLRKVQTEFIDFVEANDLQKSSRLSWTAWDDLVISAQMKRLDSNEIYSRDSDFDSIPGIKRIF
jgi:predicted nucleic acid-binding protein